MHINVKAPNGKIVTLEDGRGDPPKTFLEASLRGDFAAPGDVRLPKKSRPAVHTSLVTSSTDNGEDFEGGGLYDDKDRRGSSRRVIELRKQRALLSRTKENRNSNLAAAANQAKRNLRRRKGVASVTGHEDTPVDGAVSTRMARKERHLALKKIKFDDRKKKRMLTVLKRDSRKNGNVSVVSQ